MSDMTIGSSSTTVASDVPFVVALDDPAARDPALTGGKAAALARGRAAGLATLPGVTLTTAFSNAVDDGALVTNHPAVRDAYDRAGGDQQALVARSSSVVEELPIVMSLIVGPPFVRRRMFAVPSD